MTEQKRPNIILDKKPEPLDDTSPVLYLEDGHGQYSALMEAVSKTKSEGSSERESALLARVEKLEKINQALIRRVERSMDQRANSYSLFQSAIMLEEQVRARTRELRNALDDLETSNTHLSIAKEQAERSNSSKTKFLAAASHDLLQPLSAARLNMSALKSEDVSPQAGALISQVDRSLLTIEDLLRTLFDISKLDAGVSVPDICRFPADRIIKGLHTDFSAVAQQKELNLKVFSLPFIVDTDPIFLRRILQNLVSNALRYTHKGGVLIGCRRRGETLRFEVWDTGIGIPEHEHNRIFDEFHRGKTDIHQDGLGLGLAIVARMADAVGHDVSFQSKVGSGSVFCVSVPISKKQTDLIEDIAPLPLSETSHLKLEDAFIVLIEDDPDVRDALKTLLTKWGAQCIAADGFSQVQEKLDQVERVPDLIIADYHLLDDIVGPVVVRHIRKRFNELDDHDIPSLIVSATPSDKIMKHAAKEKCEFLNKPIEPAELRALLIHMLNE